jgi:hypothetical protein
MEGDISNIALQKTAELIILYLLHIYRASFQLNHYPASWKKYDTIVLQKPNRTDYTISKAYCPIVLLKTLAKPLSMAVTEDLHTREKQTAPRPPLRRTVWQNSHRRHPPGHKVYL